MKRSAILLALLLLGVLLIASVAASAAPPAQGTTTQPAAALPASDDAPAYLTLNLQAGFPLDPFIVSANGGGPVDASTLGEGCTGYINSNATLSVHWEGETAMVRVFYHSDHDPVLVIRTPDGNYVCNDNANRLLLDPVITIENPASGSYSIWVGSADAGQLIPGVLVITTRQEMTVGTFDLRTLVTRDPLPDTLDEPLVTAERQALADKLLKGVAALRSARDVGLLKSFSQDVEVKGEIGAHELPIGDTFCNGYIAEEPDLVFNVPEDRQNLFVYFEGDADATLVVAAPDGTFLCNDDVQQFDNVNPLVIVKEPMPGQYDVWVGRVSTDAPLKGRLTVTDLAKRPARLAPKPIPTPAQ